METKVNYAVVGAFVIALITAIVLSIIWLSSGFTYTTNVTYKLYMQESVSGLNIDSPVEFNGVGVGEVTSIELNQKDPHLVEVLLDIKTGTPITMGTIATLNTRGITGIAFVALKDKGDDLRPLVKQKGERYLVIKTGPSLFMRVDTALNKLSVNLSQVSESIQSLLNKENQRSISNILYNLDRVSATLALNSQKLNIILGNASKASETLTPLLVSSAGAAKMLETQTLPATFRLLNNLDNATRSLDEVIANIKANPTILIRGSAAPELGPGETR